MNGPKSPIEGLQVWAAGLDILKIEKNSTDLYYFIFEFWRCELWALTVPKPPMATRLGPEQLNEGALGIAHEICDWNELKQIMNREWHSEH